MKPRERVLTALDHREPDRVPIDIGSCGPTAVHEQAYRRLLRVLEVEEEVELWDLVAQSAQLSEPVLERLGADVRGIRVGGPTYNPDMLSENVLRDQWGTIWKRPDGATCYHIADYPLRDASTPADLARHPWPDPTAPARVDGLAKRARYLREQTPYAVLGEVSGHILERGQMLRGFENFLIDLALKPNFAEELMDRITDIEIGIIETFLGAVGPYLDVFAFKDDLAAQNGPLISPDMFRRFIKPRIAKLIDAIQRGTDAKIWFHSCGSVYFAIPDLIDLEIDILNPVQVAARDMDTARLKHEFGDRLAFWGAVDTQDVLPFGSPGDVKAEVERRITDLGPGGGYVLASVHNIEADVPGENIWAMAQTAQQFGRYPLQLS